MDYRNAKKVSSSHPKGGVGGDAVWLDGEARASCLDPDRERKGRRSRKGEEGDEVERDGRRFRFRFRLREMVGGRGAI